MKGKITKISDFLQVACIESDNEILYVDLEVIPEGYSKGRMVEYDITTNVDGKKIPINIRLAPSVFADWIKQTSFL